MSGPETIRIIVHKAGSTAGRPVPSLIIEAAVEFGDLSEFRDEDAAAGLHQRNARHLGEALCSCLPGGTIDRLLIYLMERKASLLRVPYERLHEER